MGEGAVPLLLAELRREPDDWFWALHAITGANPVPAASRGDLRAMTEAWLQWGIEDIIHRTPQAVAGPDPAYGEVACFMKRKRLPTS